MNEKVAILSLIELLSALSCGIVILFITYRLFRIYGSRRLGIKEDNNAYLILIASVLFSLGWILSGVINPILSYYRIASNEHSSAINLFLSFILTGGVYILITYLLSLIIILTGISLYTYMTPLKESQALKENNIGVAIVLASIIIVLSLFCKDGIILFIESIVPYPEFPPG